MAGTTIKEELKKPSSESWEVLPDVGLVIVATDEAGMLGSRFTLTHTPFRVGRDYTNDVVLECDGVSRQHAQFEKQEEEWFVVDLGSTNGTFCGRDKVVKRQRLKGGDFVRISHTNLYFIDASCDKDHVHSMFRALSMARPAEHDLPLPLAGLEAMVLAQTTPLDQVRVTLTCIQVALRFATAVLLGAVLEPAGGAERIARALGAAPDGYLRWEQLAFALAPALDRDTPVDHAAHKLLSATVDGVDLVRALHEVTELEARIARQGSLASTAHADALPFLRASLKSLLGALRPLARCKLVSIARIDGFEPTGEYRYFLREHRGPGRSPVSRHRLSFQLQNDWCYLLVPETDRAPIPLSPMVRYGACSTCGQEEMAIAEELTFTAQARVRLRGVTTGHLSEAEVPRDGGIEKLYQAIVSLGGAPAPKAAPKEEPLRPPQPLAKPPPAMVVTAGAKGRQYTIMFVGVNAPGMPEVSLIEEHRAIDLVTGQHVRVIPKFQMRVDELQQCLHTYSPHVIHFSGHGGPDGELYLEDAEGKPFPLKPDALAALIAKLDRRPRGVVLNACYSAMGAEQLKPHVDFVVGMVKKIGVEPSITFCRAFYQALVDGRSVKAAHEAGCEQIRLQDLPDSSVPALDCRPEVDPARARLFRRASTMRIR